LRDRKDKGEGHLTAERIKNLPETDMDIKAVFGLVFYDETDRTMCMQPFSIVTSGEIIRLLY
ncbi:MAG: metal-binding protein, partial [Clostridia bacterium]|nr:metal-binding protein [Clostridia bacterium]